MLLSDTSEMWTSLYYYYRDFVTELLGLHERNSMEITIVRIIAVTLMGFVFIHGCFSRVMNTGKGMPN